MPFDPDHPRFFRLFAVMSEPADGSIRLEITSGGQMGPEPALVLPAPFT